MDVQLTGLEIELAQFTGSDCFYRHLCGMYYTEGMEHLADNAGAYWLIDVIASYQPRWKNRAPFQLWRIETHKGKTGGLKALVTMREDTNEEPRVKQRISYTDFPIVVFECYAVDGVVMLKSEY